MTFWQFMRGIELRDVRTARTRAWMRLCHVSLGMAAAVILWDVFHPHDLMGAGFLGMAALGAFLLATAGALYDFWRVQHPEKTTRYEWLRIGIVSIITGVVFAFFVLWIITK
jgi:uncharacterized membrane protein HdeD (DUF308 family)